jgi:hypothetical protein
MRYHRRRVGHLRLRSALALPLLDDDLVYALPRYLEVLRQPRLVSLQETVAFQQVPDGYSELLRAMRIPLGHRF